MVDFQHSLTAVTEGTSERPSTPFIPCQLPQGQQGLTLQDDGFTVQLATISFLVFNIGLDTTLGFQWAIQSMSALSIFTRMIASPISPTAEHKISFSLLESYLPKTINNLVKLTNSLRTTFLCFFKVIRAVLKFENAFVVTVNFILPQTS